MTLSQALAALAGNTAVNITLIDDNDAVLITFGAAGYASIESDLGSKVVKYIKVNSAKEVVIAIKDPDGP